MVRIIWALAALIAFTLVVSASAIEYTIVQTIGEAAVNPPYISDNYVHFYGGTYSRSVDSTRQLSSCTFSNFDCQIDNYGFTLSYNNIRNDPAWDIMDTGEICFIYAEGYTGVKSECTDYNISVHVINMNWHAGGDTGKSIEPFISPNGYNIVPIAALACVILVLFMNRKHLITRIR